MIACAGVLSTACGHTELTALTFRAPLSPRSYAVIYPLGTELPTRYVDVAMLQATGYGNEANAQSVLAALAAKGASLGCDAVARVQISSGVTRTNAVGVCVRYLDGTPVVTGVEQPPLEPKL
jgi:hypothetical protein